MPKKQRGPHHSAPCLHPQPSGLPCPGKATRKHPYFGLICARHARGPHHTAPCQHPQSSGLPCPNRAVDHHDPYGPICALHAHHHDISLSRTAGFTVRVSPDEHTALSAVAGTLNVTLSDLGRIMLLGLEVPQPPRPRIDALAYGQLGKIGGNLNQIARGLNAAWLGEAESFDLDFEDLVAQLAALRATLDEVRLGLAGAP